MFLIKLIQIMKLTVEEMLNKYSTNSSHAVEVQRIAMLLFEEASKKIFEMSSREKEYLKAASLLHDIGYSIEAKGHNKHSMHLIIDYGIDGFNSDEVKIIACIARYHRGSLPDKTEHEFYNSLEKRERKIVKRLGGILKLADGLDKEHRKIINNIKIDFNFETRIAKIILQTNSQDIDISTAIRKRDLFEIGFKCQSVILL